MQSQHDHKQHTEGQALEDRIMSACKVQCKVIADPNTITIRANSFADYVLAKLAIKSLAGSRTITQG